MKNSTSFAIVFYPFLLLIWLALLWLRPIWLFKINQGLSRALDIQLPSWLGGIKIPVRYLLLVGFFHYHPRVLDSWVAQHIRESRFQFSRRTTVEEREVHVPLPIAIDKRSLADISAVDLKETFERNLACLSIWGEGGAGKTSLACLLGKWAMSENPDERLCSHHLMLPLIIEQDLGVQAKGNEQLFLKTIRDQLRGLINQAEPPPTELLHQLLKRRRVLVIVDSFSEMNESTRADILAGINDIPINALIITSRTNESLSGLPRTIIRPLRIKGNKLASFMEAYLSHLDKRVLFDDEQFFEACRRLSSIVGDRDITALLAKLYADQIVRAKEGASGGDLPDNILELMLCYLNDINRGASSVDPGDATVHRVAEIIAWQSLKSSFRPMPASLDDVLIALGGQEQSLPLVKYLEQKLKVVQIVGVGRNRLRFSIDPLAEYLAGLHVVNLYGGNEELWRSFLLESDEKDGAPAAIKGFLLAVRDCCLTKGEEIPIPAFVVDELARRAGLTPEDKQKARSERRIKRLIRDLRSVDAEDRREAAKAIGDMKGEGQLAVAALTEALKDRDNLVRVGAANALGRIRSVGKTAVTALMELLNETDDHLRSSAALALLIVAREETAALTIPVLIDALRHEDLVVNESTHYVLRNLGPEVKAAVPTLIGLLRHKDGHIRMNAAFVLGRVGPEAESAILALIELLKDKDYPAIRSAVVNALERIGPVVLPALVDALRNQDAAVRLGAVYVLGRFRFRPDAQAATDALVEALKDRDEDVRSGAAYALVNVPGRRLKDAIPALIKLLSEPDASIRWGATIALGTAGPEARAAIPKLILLLKDKDEDVRSGAAKALANMGQAALPALKIAKQDESTEVQDTINLIIERAYIKKGN